MIATTRANSDFPTTGGGDELQTDDLGARHHRHDDLATRHPDAMRLDALGGQIGVRFGCWLRFTMPDIIGTGGGFDLLAFSLCGEDCLLLLKLRVIRRRR
jgi:hypothetical protein